MSVYLILELEITDPGSYAEYVRRVPDTLMHHGGRYVVRGGRARWLPGSPSIAAPSSPPSSHGAQDASPGWRPDRIVVVEFPSLHHLERWSGSPEYRAIIPLRTRAARTRAVVVDAYAHARPALVPELYVSSLERSLELYVGLLGFRVAYARPESRFASLYLGSAHLMLEEVQPTARPSTRDELARGDWRTAELEHPFGRGMNLEIQTTDVDATHAALRAAGHPPLLAPHEREYRIAEGILTVYQMLIEDPDGYLIRLSERRRLRAGGESEASITSEAGS